MTETGDEEEGTPDARQLSIHALRATLFAVRQMTESALATLAALEASNDTAPRAAAVSPELVRHMMSARDDDASLTAKAHNVFGRVREKQQAATAGGDA